MEAEQVLHMNGGLGETSYANNSSVQRKVITMTKSVAEEAITQVYCTIINMASSSSNTFSMAELGCSSGPNALLVAAEMVKTVHKLSRKHGRDSPEFQIFLNDLPGNDFNSISQYSIPSFHAQLKEIEGGLLGKCFVYGAPGSFYGRLFGANTIHFLHSSYSLMWLSKVPEGLEMNKENIYIGRESPASVIEAYYHQFRRDFVSFLKFRSEEVVVGGIMVLTILGRKSERPTSKDCCYIWELLAISLRELVSEGVIEEEKVHSFNIPQYTPSPAEVKREVEKEGSFTITYLQTTQVKWAACNAHNNNNNNNNNNSNKMNGYNVAKCMRSVAEPLLVQHFGESIIDQLFEKYKNIISDRMAKEEPNFINVTISMTRKEDH